MYIVGSNKTENNELETIFPMTKRYTVEGVTAYIRDLLDHDPPLQDIWVRGEVSNMRVASSGHWYFTLKDEYAQLKCVMFRSAAERQSIEPRDGAELQIHGRIGVYEARGEYQLYADEIQTDGSVGDLYAQFEALKARLQAEGLFEADRKRPLPASPLRIGVVTSPDAAAFRDVQNVLSRRFPLAQVILSPTLVQGSEAPSQIVQAIERINTHQAADVLLIVRGGGSIEDLWGFNEERVARAIAASDIPTICGVGHETDFTIADFVADQRAPTPSAAAELAVPNVEDMRATLHTQTQELTRGIQDALAAHRANVALLQRTLGYHSPARTVREMQQRMDDWRDRLEMQLLRQLALLHERLQARTRQLEAASPDALLQRGYAIVTRSDDDRPILREDDAPPGTGVTIRLKEGELKARVEDKGSHGLYKRTLF